MSDISMLPVDWCLRSRAKRIAIWMGWLALVALFVWCWQIMRKYCCRLTFNCPEWQKIRLIKRRGLMCIA